MRISLTVLLFLSPAMAVRASQSFCEAVVESDRPSLFKSSAFDSLAAGTPSLDKHEFVLYLERMTGSIQTRYEGSIANSMIYSLKTGRARYARIVGYDQIVNFIHRLPSTEDITLGRTTAVLTGRLVGVGVPLTYGA